MKQTTFAGLAFDAKKKRTRREQFMSEMDAVIPWNRLLALIEPRYPVAGQGRPPLGLERMLRIYFMQQWFNLSDPRPKMRCMTVSRCAASPASNWVMM